MDIYNLYYIFNGHYRLHILLASTARYQAQGYPTNVYTADPNRLELEINDPGFGNEKIECGYEPERFTGLKTKKLFDFMIDLRRGKFFMSAMPVMIREGALGK